MDKPEDISKLYTALLESEQKFRYLSNLMPVGVYTTDKNGVITFFNDSAANLWGRTPRLNDSTDLSFSGSLKMYTPQGDVIPHHEFPMAKALRFKKSIRDEEITIEKPDGSRLSFIVNIEILFDVNGELSGAINVFQDITEKKKAEIGLRRLAAIVESSEDAIISKTLNGIITSWNAAAEKMFGYSENEIIGQPINILIPQSNQDEERRIISKIKAGEKIDHFETVRMRKDGSELNISLSVSPIKNDNGQIIGASKIARDITRKVELDNKLRMYTDQLKELNNYKDEFMAMASHELKTPLTVIKANLQLLALQLQYDPNYGFVDKTMKQVNKLGNLISDLFDVSKIQAGQLQLNYSEFDLNELLAETIGSIAHTFNTHKIQIVAEEEPIRITADYLRLEQVLINIITNAIKYSPTSDTVIITARRDNGNVIISIKDFGIGIPKEDQEKVFSRFFRVRGLASTFSGSGIGLYISSEIIKHHGGNMWVESEENIGSTFYFSIPANKPLLPK
jgi:PAS domain S-box-containing protein